MRRLVLVVSLLALCAVLVAMVTSPAAGPDPVDAEYTPQTAAPAVVIPGGLPRG